MGRPRRAAPRTPLYIAPDIHIDPTIIISGPATTTQEIPLFERTPAPPPATPSSTVTDVPVTDIMDVSDPTAGPALKVNNSVVSATSQSPIFATLTRLKPPHQKHRVFLREWAQSLLDSLYSREVPHSDGRTCARCHQCQEGEDIEPQLYRCRQCFDLGLLCSSCMCSAHQDNPFHRLRRWTGTHFVDDTLSNIGVVIRLGCSHPGKRCRSRAEPEKTKTMTVLHCNGFQKCQISYCSCLPEGGFFSEAAAVQLVKAGLFPASFKQPQTVFTLEVLEEFRHLSHHAKVNGRDFIATKTRMTNNAFRKEVSVSLTCVLELICSP